MARILKLPQLWCILLERHPPVALLQAPSNQWIIRIVLLQATTSQELHRQNTSNRCYRQDKLHQVFHSQRPWPQDIWVPYKMDNNCQWRWHLWLHEWRWNESFGAHGHASPSDWRWRLSSVLQQWFEPRSCCLKDHDTSTTTRWRSTLPHLPHNEGHPSKNHQGHLRRQKFPQLSKWIMLLQVMIDQEEAPPPLQGPMAKRVWHHTSGSYYSSFLQYRRLRGHLRLWCCSYVCVPPPLGVLGNLTAESSTTDEPITINSRWRARSIFFIPCCQAK